MDYTILIYENVPPEKRKQGRLVLRADGAVERFTETELQQRLSELEARYSAMHRLWKRISLGKESPAN